MTEIDPALIEAENAGREAGAARATTPRSASSSTRRGIDIEAIKAQVAAFGVAVPSWGVGTGGTRFARFPGPGEPRDIFDKLDDCAVIHELTGATPTVSLHIPWDKADPAALREQGGRARARVRRDELEHLLRTRPASRSPTSSARCRHTDAAVRAQAVEHNLECIEIGRALGLEGADGLDRRRLELPRPVALHPRVRALPRRRCAQVYAALPDDWRVFTEHKMYEPAFYSTVVQDWGTNYLIAQELGPKAFCLVDLGHHAPNVNIEMIVARLIQFGKLGGFHFNDSKYGDDDLDAGSIDPYRLFLVFNELVDAEDRGAAGFHPAHMLDQSHNVTDPIESLMVSAMEVQRAYAQALLVDRAALDGFQEANDALMASATLKAAFRTDVEPILALARLEKGAAIDPVAAFRTSRLPREGRRAPARRSRASAAASSDGPEPCARPSCSGAGPMSKASSAWSWPSGRTASPPRRRCSASRPAAFASTTTGASIPAGARGRSPSSAGTRRATAGCGSSAPAPAGGWTARGAPTSTAPRSRTFRSPPSATPFRSAAPRRRPGRASRSTPPSSTGRR